MEQPDALEPVLRGIREFLDHQASGSASVRRRTLAFLAAQGAAEERVRQEYTGRYPMELLQNAHDACAEADHVGSVDFWLTPTALLVANEGVAFDEEHIESLVRLGLSEKATHRSEHKTIGYKGIGFSSVFEISENPQIITSTLAFAFDRERARGAIEEAFAIAAELVPVRAFPYRITESAWSDDSDTVAQLFLEGAVTVVRLPLRDPAVHARVAESLVTSVPAEALLFSPYLKSISVTIEGETTTWQRTSARRHGGGQLVYLQRDDGTRRGWLVAAGKVRVDAKLIERLDDRLWADVRELGYAVALPWRGGVLPGERPHRLHVYYPTDDVLDRAVLVHGDFYGSSDRRRIETDGVGGEVSRIVANAAAVDLARLAETVAATQGAALLHALAPGSGSDGFGQVMGAAIDAALRDARIARTATGRCRTAGELAVFDTRGLGEPASLAFSRMFGRQPDLLNVTDGDATSIPFLEGLDATLLLPAAAAERIKHSPPSRYAERAAALAEWLDVLDRRHAVHARAAEAVLKRKPVLVDTKGSAMTPNGAVLRIADVPPLPPKLEKSEVKVLRSPAAQQLLQRLDVEELDLDAAVDVVLDAVWRGFGRNREEGESVLTFLEAAWRRNHRAIEGKSRLVSVRVPARTAIGTTVRWVSAQGTYLSRAWVGNDNLERLYGPFKEHEFLAIEPPSRNPARLRAFYAALGVKDAPAAIVHNGDWADLWAHFGFSGARWRRAIDPREEGACPDHPRSQRARVEVLDRLDEILGELSARRATALAALLAESASPLGGEAVLTCNHGGHKRPPLRKATGYQEWLLRASAWIPTREQEDGPVTLRRPIASWRGVTREFAGMAFPRAALSKRVAEALPLPSPGNPTVEALEHLMRDLHNTHPDLAPADDRIRETARWAQQQLDRLLRRGVARKRTFPLVADLDGALVWSDDPVVADAPGARDIPGVPVVHGRCSNLQHVFGLRTARQDLTITVAQSPRVLTKPYLSTDVKAAILAFLDARGGDRAQIATRLARLRERALQQVYVNVTYNGKSVEVERSSYLEVARDRRGAVRGGMLFWSPRREPNTLSLAEELAAYIGDVDDAEAIALLLSARSDVLDRHHITDRDLEWSVSEFSRQLGGRR